jgi:hypothetical protein
MRLIRLAIVSLSVVALSAFSRPSHARAMTQCVGIKVICGACMAPTACGTPQAGCDWYVTCSDGCTNCNLYEPGRS